MKNTKQIISSWILCCLIVLLSHSSYAGLPIDVAGQPLPSLADMLEKTTPAVVNISTEGTTKNIKDPILDDPFFRHFFGKNIIPPTNRKIKGKGSGVIIDADNGYVLTNYHVVFNTSKIVVTLNDGRKFLAKLIGGDAKVDIAVLSIPVENLLEMPIANSDELRVGDFVVAIGHPYGLGQSVTSGIISALGRSNLGIEEYEDFIQTDASINPGSSGGALVNLKGELIGINTAILGGNGGGNVGIGFAIPSNMAMNIMRQLVNFGSVKRGQLGIEVHDINQELMLNLGLENRKGAVISRTIIGSPANEAGLKTNDVIKKINNKIIKNGKDVLNYIGALRIGDEVTIHIIRKGQLEKIRVVLGKVSVKAYNKKLKSSDNPKTVDNSIPKPEKKTEILEIPIWENGLW